MPYTYSEMRPELFTEMGAEVLTKVRRNVEQALAVGGAVRAQEAWRHVGGDSWKQIAALDYMVEKGEIREVTDQAAVFAQHRVFVPVK